MRFQGGNSWTKSEGAFNGCMNPFSSRNSREIEFGSTVRIRLRQILDCGLPYRPFLIARQPSPKLRIGFADRDKQKDLVSWKRILIHASAGKCEGSRLVRTNGPCVATTGIASCSLCAHVSPAKDDIRPVTPRRLWSHLRR